MMENRNTIGDLSADELPVPVCRFRVENGTPVVSGTNGEFGDQLIAVRGGDSLGDVFDSLGASDQWERTALTSGTGFRVTVSDTEGGKTEYLVDVSPAGDSDEGYLLFTEVPSATDETERPSTGGDSTDSGIAVDHVASVVSHDLRNPLDVARARLEAAREFDEDEHFEHVERAHERMERIIQDVLTLARGEDVVDPDQTVDLGTLAQEAWETVETNGATLSVEGELPTALADPDRVSRLFENLFRNSVEHGSTDGNEQVTVTVRSLTGDEVGFCVADDGPGIPDAEQSKVFEPGYSSDDHGTGLGLAIVARIVDLHGWDVEVTDSATGGARFDISGVEQQ